MITQNDIKFAVSEDTKEKIVTVHAFVLIQVEKKVSSNELVQAKHPHLALAEIKDNMSKMLLNRIYKP